MNELLHDTQISFVPIFSIAVDHFSYPSDTDGTSFYGRIYCTLTSTRHDETG